MDTQSAAKAMERITAMHDEAKRITETVGLPKEATYIVLSIIWHFKQHATEEVTEAAVIAYVQERIQEAKNLTEALELSPDKVVMSLSVLQDWSQDR